MPLLDEMKMKSKPIEHAISTEKGLDKLLLDPENPRFGRRDKIGTQQKILDYIVENFGVDDVLSSIAVNGYFDAEPLVCRSESSGDCATVVEGNRRLAASLIIIGDERASNQSKRTERYSRIWRDHDKPKIEPVPIILYPVDQPRSKILAYLGVRHIASSQPWDSYAKAAWVAQVMRDSDLDIDQISEMIGDEHNTIARLLEGFYLVDQLSSEGQFRPEDSVRRGRGSVTEFPFSWVYTILGYAQVREFLGIVDSAPREGPLGADSIENGGLLLKFLFGNKSEGRNPAITDSRQLGALATALASRRKITMLAQGKSLNEIITLTQPLDRRLSDGLSIVEEILKDLVGRLSAESLDPKDASEILSSIVAIRRLAGNIEKTILGIASGEDVQSD